MLHDFDILKRLMQDLEGSREWFYALIAMIVMAILFLLMRL